MMQDANGKQSDQQQSAADFVDEAQAEKKKRTQAHVLAEHAKAASLFHTPAGESYADIPVGGHRETLRVRSRAFRGWLRKRYYEATGSPPNGEALATAIDLIDAQAQFDGPKRDVHVRIAAHDDKIYLDLADDNWRVVEIDAAGWRVIKDPPVRFRRAGGMLPLPTPEPGGSLEDLRALLNVRSDHDCVLIVAWLLAALRGKGPYPVLAIAGEPGTAKSTCCAILRALVDPNAAPLRAMPRDDRDLFIAASNAHVVALDNVSGLQPWLSDTLCRLATGGGFATRRLHTDDEEALFSGQRPIVANGIEDIIGRSDLADRSILVVLDPIAKNNRLAERDLWARFSAAQPRIIGTLLDAVAHGLRHLPTTILDQLPRMADFALWAAACESALWEPGAFAAAYAGNREDATSSAIEADLVATAIMTMMETRTEWSGTAQALLGLLGGIVSENIQRHKDWPRTPRAVGGALRRAAPLLRRRGIEVSPPKGSSHKDRTWWITSAPPQEDTAAEQPQQPPQPRANDFNGLDGGDCAGDGGGDRQQPPQRPPANPLRNKAGGDGGDVAGSSSRGGTTNGGPTNHPCSYCGSAGVFPDDPTTAYDHPTEEGALVWLHRRCEAPFAESVEALRRPPHADGKAWAGGRGRQ
jgi:hypothetical protein